MKLLTVLENVEFITLRGSINGEFNAIQYDSRLIKKNDIFVCITGYETDGHIFIKNAISNGASIIICEKNIDLSTIKENVTILKTNCNRKTLALMASNFYGHPNKKLKLIGVTGTNGKTTSVYIIKTILEEAGIKVGQIGTVANYIDNVKIPSERTTPESLELHKLFNDMVDAGCEYCVMEVSSHSLALDRVYGCEFEFASFTNITRDHLEFHKNFDNYYNAKFKLFEMCTTAVVNIDNNYGRKLVKNLKSLNKYVYTYSLTDPKSNCMAKNFKIKGTNVVFSLDDFKYEFVLPGKYNISNALGAIAITKLMKIDNNIIKNGLLKVVVPGRCEIISEKYNLPFKIVIDYAHTPDGLKNVLSALKPFCKNRLIALYGSGGDRETKKRHELGKIGSEFADLVILSSDNPKEEDPIHILNEISDGITKNNYVIIENRMCAIKYAIDIAKKGDILVLAGKGHENYQIEKNGKVYFNEKEVLDKLFTMKVGKNF